MCFRFASNRVFIHAGDPNESSYIPFLFFYLSEKIKGEFFARVTWKLQMDTQRKGACVMTSVRHLCPLVCVYVGNGQWGGGRHLVRKFYPYPNNRICVSILDRRFGTSSLVQVFKVQLYRSYVDVSKIYFIIRLVIDLLIKIVVMRFNVLVQLQIIG